MQTLLVELNEEEFEGLVTLAKRRGTSPASLVNEWLEKDANRARVVTTLLRDQAEDRRRSNTRRRIRA